MVWLGAVWFGEVRCGKAGSEVWYGTVWLGKVRSGEVWQGKRRHWCLKEGSIPSPLSNCKKNE